MKKDLIKAALVTENPMAKFIKTGATGIFLHYSAETSHGTAYFMVPKEDAPENLLDDYPAVLLREWFSDYRSGSVDVKSLDINQAIARGFTHCTIYQGDKWYRLSYLVDNGVPESFKGEKIVLLDKNKTPLHIDADTIRELLRDHIDDQEDYYCEDDSIYDELCEADWEAIEKLVNAGFKPRFMFPTEIELILYNNEG